MTLATAAALTVGFSATATPASAASDCGIMPADWYRVYPAWNNGPGASAQVWKYPGTDWLVARIANTAANGKTNLLASGGTDRGRTDLGTSPNIGSAPNGAWCSTPYQGRIWSSVRYNIGGGARYDFGLYCTATTSRAYCER